MNLKESCNSSYKYFLPNMVYTCMRCGYETKSKARYDAHVNRKYPCKDSRGNRDESVDIDKLATDQSSSSEVKQTQFASFSLNSDGTPTKTTIKQRKVSEKNSENKMDPENPYGYRRTVETSVDDNGNTHTVVNNDIDLNIHIDYKLLLREDLGQVMMAILNEPNNMEAFKDLYQIKVPMKLIHEEYTYPRIISMFDDYVMFMNARRIMKTFTDTDNKNLLSFAPGLFNGIYINAIIKTEESSSRIGNIFRKVFMNGEDEEEEEEKK